MERAIENGEPVLLENLGEGIDAVLGPIVARQFFKKNRNLYVKLGDKEVEVHVDCTLASIPPRVPIW
jgi:dynein heavy chain